MVEHEVRAWRAAESPPRERELAWHIAALAADPGPVAPEVASLVADRVLDDLAVAVAALDRPAPAAARAQALPHHLAPGAPLIGLGRRAAVSPEWAAWANGTAVRELDLHDTYLAADYSHPGDTIPPLLAVAQHAGLSGAALVPAIAVGYEVQMALVRGICLHEHGIDHIAHLAPAVAAGLGALLALPRPVTYQAVQQALHTATATRQSRKGSISSWKAFAPAFAGKVAVEAVDRAMRGQGAPSPIWEGEDGVIARLLGGFEARYTVALPAPGEGCRAILDSYTKEHAAEYQAQAVIDLAFRMRPRVGDTSRVSEVVLHTSHHTHHVIGSGAGDPQKYDPGASRETLDHSVMYIAAVALEDGVWHHGRSYAPERARRPGTVALWRRIRTVEDARWTARYHHPDPARRAFGARMVVTMDDGTVIEDELAVADAHPAGSRPFGRAGHRAKWDALAVPVLGDEEAARVAALAAGLGELTPAALRDLSPAAPAGALGEPVPGGLW